MPLITLIRTAPTAWNLERRIQGRADDPLSPKGRDMASAWSLPNSVGSVWLSSPLARARETAACMGCTVKTDQSLVEMDWGEWQGRTLRDLRRNHRTEMAENEAKGLDFRPRGGESPRDVQARVLPLLQSFDRNTVLITHKGVLRAVYALATNWDMKSPPKDRLRNAHGHRFRLTDSSLSVDRLNIALEHHRSPDRHRAFSGPGEHQP